MAYVYETVPINSFTYDVYASIADAEQYLDASVTEGAVAWQAITDPNQQARLLVSATRWLDAAPWLGTMSDPITPQALQWPRTGLEGIDPDIIPPEIGFACCELAGMLAVDPDLRVNMNTPLIKEQHAGSVGQTYFRPTSVQATTFFPAGAVMGYVSPWLSGAGAGGAPVGAIPHDVHEKSELRRPFDFQHGI